MEATDTVTTKAIKLPAQETCSVQQHVRCSGGSHELKYPPKTLTTMYKIFYTQYFFIQSRPLFSPGYLVFSSTRLYFLNKLKLVLNNLLPSSNADRDLVQSALHVGTVCLLKEVTISLVVSARGWKNLCFVGGYWGGGVSGSLAGTLSCGFWRVRNRFRTGGSRGRSIWRHGPQCPGEAGGRCPVT